MSIATEIQELTQNTAELDGIRTDIRTALAGKGVSASDHNYADFATDISSIPSGPSVTKGLVFSDYDSDGYPTKAEFMGSWTVIPAGFYSMDAANIPVMFSRMTSIAIPEGVTTIQNKAFRNQYLYNITLPNGLTTIGNVAFGNVHCSEIRLPSSYVQTGIESFANMYYTTNLVFEGDVTSVARLSFDGVGKNSGATATFDFSHCTSVPTLENVNAFVSTNAKIIKVPQSLLSEWQTATNWVGVTNVTWQGV